MDSSNRTIDSYCQDRVGFYYGSLKMQTRILQIEDVEGNDYEFEVTFSDEKDWSNLPMLIQLGQSLMKQHHNNENDIININILTLN